MKKTMIIAAILLCLPGVVSCYGGAEAITTNNEYNFVTQTPDAIKKLYGMGNASIINNTPDMIRLHVTFEDDSTEQFTLNAQTGRDFGVDHPQKSIKTISGNYATNGVTKQIMAFDGMGKACVIYGPITGPEYAEPYYAVAADETLKY